MVSAETAMLMPLGVAFAFLLMWVISLGVLQVRLVDSSREAARMIARGEPVSTATGAAQKFAPEGAHVKATSSDGYVTVTVSGSSSMPVPFFSSVGAQTLDATAVAALEAP